MLSSMSAVTWVAACLTMCTVLVELCAVVDARVGCAGGPQLPFLPQRRTCPQLLWSEGGRAEAFRKEVPQ